MAEKLTFVEAVRKRPSMYIGSTNRLGLAHLYEYVMSAFLEGLQAKATFIRVKRDRGEATVSTDAVLPAEATLAALTTSDTSPSDWPLLTVAALSSRFALDIQSDDGGWWAWRSEHGRAVAGEPLRASTGPGTIVSFAPDATIFEDVNAVTGAWLQRRMTELAMLTPGLRVELDDVDGLQLHLTWPNGFTDWLAAQEVEVVQDVSTQWQAVRIHAAFGYSRTPGNTVLGFVNGVRVAGGHHVEALRSAVNGFVGPTRRGWVGVISIEMEHERVRFEGPTKEVLRVEGLGDGLRETLVAALTSPERERLR